MDFGTVIIGAGLTGLKKAIDFYEANEKNVLLVDYAEDMGSFIKDVGLLQGREDNEVIAMAKQLPYTFWNKSTVTDIRTSDCKTLHDLTIQTIHGPTTVSAEHIVIATGAIEKARGANRITGTRPAGEMTPTLAAGLLKRNYLPGLNPLIVMDNDLAQAVAVRLNIYPQCNVITRDSEDMEVVDIQGYPRVREVTLRDKESNKVSIISCDSLIFSHGQTPNVTFLGHINIDLTDSNYICTNRYGLTSVPGIYAFGDCAECVSEVPS